MEKFNATYRQHSDGSLDVKGITPVHNRYVQPENIYTIDRHNFTDTANGELFIQRRLQSNIGYHGYFEDDHGKQWLSFKYGDREMLFNQHPECDFETVRGEVAYLGNPFCAVVQEYFEWVDGEEFPRLSYVHLLQPVR